MENLPIESLESVLIKLGDTKLIINEDSGVKHLVHPTNQWGTACGRILKARERREANATTTVDK